MRLFAFLLLSLFTQTAFAEKHYTIDTFIEAAADENFEEAAKQAEVLLKSEPNNSFLRLELSRLYLELNRVDDSKKTFESLNSKRIEDPKSYALYGWRLYSRLEKQSRSPQRDSYLKKATAHLRELFQFNSVWNYSFVKEVEAFLKSNKDAETEKLFKEKLKILRK